MTIEMVAVVAVAVVPAGLFLGWLMLLGAVIAALGASSEPEAG